MRAPPCLNQLPMAHEPHNFIHMKDLGAGTPITVFEEGADNLKLSESTAFQKYFRKMQMYPYIGYNHQVDMPSDPFLDSLSQEQKKQFYKKMKEIWKQQEDDVWPKEDHWYMIMEGPEKVKLYQDKVWKSIFIV